MAQYGGHCQFIRILYKMLLKYLVDKDMTLSCLAPILKDLRDKLAIKADDSNMLKIAKGAMMKDFDDRFLDTNMQLQMTKATFLDPRFKKFPHLS